MKYLNRKGDIDQIASIPSTEIFNNWEEKIPEFCFIVPTYKRADLLKFALLSILGQETEDCYEVLVVDDNPQREDETETLMKSMFNLKNIAYFKNAKNHRQEGNWNKLFYLARTKWMIMLHDDDMLYPDYMKYLKKCMTLYPKNIGGFFPQFIAHEFSDDTLPERMVCNIKARVIKEFDFLQGCVLGAPLGMCVRRDITLKIGGVNHNSGVAVDYDFFNRLVKETDVIKMYNYPLGIWRVMDNVSQKKETVLSCVEWGDVLKTDTLEDLGLNFLSPLYKSYLRAFDRQHVISWFKSMKKGNPSSEDLKKCNAIDRLLFRGFVMIFAICRRLRLSNKTIKVDA